MGTAIWTRLIVTIGFAAAAAILLTRRAGKRGQN